MRGAQKIRGITLPGKRVPKQADVEALTVDFLGRLRDDDFVTGTFGIVLQSAGGAAEHEQSSVLHSPIAGQFPKAPCGLFSVRRVRRRMSSSGFHCRAGIQEEKLAIPATRGAPASRRERVAQPAAGA